MNRQIRLHQRRAVVTPKRSVLAAILVAASALAASVSFTASARGQQAGGAVHKPSATTQKPAPSVSLAPPVKMYGSKSAPITLELFTDYECPTCRAFFEQTLRYVISDYVAAGKVFVLHHDFPLSMHTYSGEAARWANAAATVGQFATVEAALYDNQEAWTADGNIAKFVVSAMPASDYKKVSAIMAHCPMPAPQVSAPGSDPMKGVASGCPIDTFILDDIKLGDKVPVEGTPTYVISYKGQKLPPGSGFVSWPVLKQFFDSLLAH